MKLSQMITLLCLLLCLIALGSSCVSVNSEHSNGYGILFLPFAKINHVVGSSFSASFRYQEGTNSSQTIGVRVEYYYRTNDFINHLTGVTVWTNGTQRALQSAAELDRVRMLLKSAQDSPAFRYYDEARWQFLHDMDEYSLLCEDKGETIVGNRVVFSERVKFQVEDIAEFRKYFMLKYSHSADNVSFVCREILKLLEGLTVEDIQRLEH